MSDYSSISFKNNGKLKLLIIVGTRPEIIRLAAVINQTQVPEYKDAAWKHAAEDREVMVLHCLVVDPQIF